MKNLTLWASKSLPFASKLQAALPDIHVELISNGSEIKCGISKLHGFFIDKPFLKKYPDIFKEINPYPHSALVWCPKRNWWKDEYADSLLFEEIHLFNAKTLRRVVKNLFRGVLLEKELTVKKGELRDLERENKELLQVGVALSAEQDNDKLLEMILSITRKITRADAGSIYRVIHDEKTGKRQLLFKITQNDSNPTDYTEFIMPLNKKSISGWVASTVEILNIKDAYKIPGDKEYSFNKNYDKASNYRTKSMLTVPMLNHKKEVIGVIQLINRKVCQRKRFCGKKNIIKCVVPFTKKNEAKVMSLASQAAVSMENNMLYQEIEALFEGFVTASVKAIESRDPTTSGHSYRVAEYTVALAKVVDNISSGKYKRTSFSPQEIKEIRYASLLHDFGKVGVRENVLVKAKKLYPSQLEIIKSRFTLIIGSLENRMLKKKFDLLLREGEGGLNAKGSRIEAEFGQEIAKVRKYLENVIRYNEPTILNREAGAILDEIKQLLYETPDGLENRFLMEDEYLRLRIKKGSLDEHERLEIESHVTHTYNFLKTIPWTKEMKNIPDIAYGHHEKLNGEGYPEGRKAREISVQTRMMTIADIYDALTARDRPYKRAVSMEKALQILHFEVKDNHIDPELLKIFINAKIFHQKDILLD